MEIEISGKICWNIGPQRKRPAGSKRGYLINDIVIMDDEENQYPFTVFGDWVQKTNCPKGTEVKAKFKLSHRRYGGSCYPVYKLITFEVFEEETTESL